MPSTLPKILENESLTTWSLGPRYYGSAFCSGTHTRPWADHSESFLRHFARIYLRLQCQMQPPIGLLLTLVMQGPLLDNHSLQFHVLYLSNCLQSWKMGVLNVCLPEDLVRLHSYRQKIQEGRQGDNIIPSKTVLTPSGHPRAHHSFLTHPDLFKLYYPGGPWRNVSMSIMVNNKD